MSSSSRSFEALGSYLVAGRSGHEQDRVGWSASRNLPTDDPELGAKIMRATAAQNVRVDKPVYHLALSFDPNDAVDRAAMERVADRVLDALGLEGHQVIIVSHMDRGHPHVHLLVNRVHPETGKVWSRWQDQRVVQQVLREEERALGLRQVQGTLSLSLTDMEQGRGASDDTAPSLAPRGGERAPSAGKSHVAVDELASAIRTHERVSDLTQQQYSANLDADSARARAAQVESAFERARAAEEAFVRALGAVYRAPEDARRAFVNLMTKRRVEDVIRLMRDVPEHFGPLVSVEVRRLLGPAHSDDSLARMAAPEAAQLGAAAVAAERAAWAVASDVRARRLDESFLHALRPLYLDPAAVKTAFHAVALERGPDAASTVLREQPVGLGELGAGVRDDLGRVAVLAHAAAEIGREAARADAGAVKDMVDTWDAMRAAREVAAEHAASQLHSRDATERERLHRREIDGAPALPDLQRQIAHAAARLLPHELRRLRGMVSAPQMAVVMTLRATVRDALLAREAEHGI